MSEFLTDCVFTGVEAEGPDRGILTIFIADNNISEKNLKKLPYLNTYKRFYFGAGGTYSLPQCIEKTPYILFSFIKDNPGAEFVFETRLPYIRDNPWILSVDRLNIILTVAMNTIPKSGCKIKALKFNSLDLKSSTYFPIYNGEGYTTYFNDINYSEDRKVE